MIEGARVVNVILVTAGADRIYFTLEGVEIGRFVSGKRVDPEPKVVEEKPKSAVTKAPSPKQVKRQREIENDELLKVENRIPVND